MAVCIVTLNHRKSFTICVKLPSKFHFIKHAKLGNVVLILIGHQLLYCEISLVLLSVVSTQHYTVIVLRRPYQMCRMSSLHPSISQRDNISQISFFLPVLTLCFTYFAARSVNSKRGTDSEGKTIQIINNTISICNKFQKGYDYNMMRREIFEIRMLGLSVRTYLQSLYYFSCTVVPWSFTLLFSPCFSFLIFYRLLICFKIIIEFLKIHFLSNSQILVICCSLINGIFNSSISERVVKSQESSASSLLVSFPGRLHLLFYFVVYYCGRT